MAGQGLKIAIQILLGLVIVALAYWLYVSITEPWDRIEAEREVTRQTQQRMAMVRTALIRHERRTGTLSPFLGLSDDLGPRRFDHPGQPG